MLPHPFLQKSADRQKNSLDQKKITRFKICALKLAVLLEIIHWCVESPENLETFCKFVKIDHDEAWKIIDPRHSSFFQEQWFSTFLSVRPTARDEQTVICEQRWIQFELQNSPSSVFAFGGKIYTTI